MLLIEQDEARCEELSGKLPPEVCIIHGDASSQFLLESEGIHDCDAVVTMTGMDEMNMIISLYAQTCGVPQVITKVGHMENNSMQGQSGTWQCDLPERTLLQYDCPLCPCHAEYNRCSTDTAQYCRRTGRGIEFVVDADTKTYRGTIA